MAGRCCRELPPPRLDTPLTFTQPDQDTVLCNNSQCSAMFGQGKLSLGPRRHHCRYCGMSECFIPVSGHRLTGQSSAVLILLAVGLSRHWMATTAQWCLLRVSATGATLRSLKIHLPRLAWPPPRLALRRCLQRTSSSPMRTESVALPASADPYPLRQWTACSPDWHPLRIGWTDPVCSACIPSPFSHHTRGLHHQWLLAQPARCLPQPSYAVALPRRGSGNG